MNATATCRQCLRGIVWARTVRGRPLALDPSPDARGNQAAYRDAAGTWRTRQLKQGEEPAAYERRMMPHPATCTGHREQLPSSQLPPRQLPDNVIPITRAARRRRSP